ncbi:hypothetical protein HPP92_003034 [Vanilla planifolia]|uniref:Uncharacterized protein n=1 Tax=Vanilla planifolia TaxID=51239 RepID=A0A835RWY6_VANPL|nr:hypothetical protein HPP92_003034 [Vanilla planifolia]
MAYSGAGILSTFHPICHVAHPIGHQFGEAEVGYEGGEVGVKEDVARLDVVVDDGRLRLVVQDFQVSSLGKEPKHIFYPTAALKRRTGSGQRPVRLQAGDDCVVWSSSNADAEG